MIDYYLKLTIFDLLTVCVEIALAVTALINIKNIKLKLSFTAMAVSAALWHISLASSPVTLTALSWQFQNLEILRYSSWLAVLIYLLIHSRKTKIPLQWPLSINICTTLCLIIFCYGLTRSLAEFPYPILWLYVKILFCLAAIVMAEQLLRNPDSSRIAKFVGLVVITQVAYDTLVYCNLLLQISNSNSLWYARGFISSSTSLLLTLSIIIYPFKQRQESQFKLSNTVILFNTSFILAGTFLVSMSLLGFAVKSLSIQWAEVLEILFYVMAVFAIATLSCMEKFRRRVNVWTSKHFFTHKYDYHKQWIKLDILLSKKKQESNSYETALLAMTTLFDCNKGGIWIKGQQFFSLVAVKNLDLQSTLPIESNDSDFIQIMEQQEWVFQAPRYSSDTDNSYNGHLPEWFVNTENAWTIVPLNNRNDLIGFIVLCKESVLSCLTWEDLDILKLTGRQVASYIDHQQASEKLIQNKKFDLFNKVTAFAIHDIKNLVAQQRLMIKNADKFKHEPEFVSDVILTITNSVKKMDQLLIKLQGNPQGNMERVNVNDALLNALEMNSNGFPKPVLSINGPTAFVMADPDKLLMVINHLIKNAQDATPDNGSIAIKLNTQKEALWLEIKDSGCGMEQFFINELLFKPFSSTKKNEGMGLGAYQIRELIHSLQGELFVESVKEKGTTFSIYLPLNIAEKDLNKSA
ncbi:XrtA/PEP-CTERM system histidine kinase PrsK [Psychromonas ossibalaenae]|uniref:XrtA/PEP-CTERM system histidine kinase PrsK n=1 Tax=Psychromonas ossibalaenae TaxID=444922 RepID=UPI00036C23EA|nr:XrtA/PEP-CTERM system histidine kinase PrsK [Psychromonas ossibalaenae]